jgi:hypothetical protein
MHLLLESSNPAMACQVLLMRSLSVGGHRLAFFGSRGVGRGLWREFGSTYKGRNLI